MKKNFLFTLVGAIGIATGFSSCKKCQTCTYTYQGVSESKEFCEDDFNSEDLYDQAVAYYVSLGANCD